MIRTMAQIADQGTGARSSDFRYDRVLGTIVSLPFTLSRLLRVKHGCISTGAEAIDELY